MEPDDDFKKELDKRTKILTDFLSMVLKGAAEHYEQLPEEDKPLGGVYEFIESARQMWIIQNIASLQLGIEGLMQMSNNKDDSRIIVPKGRFS